MAQLLERQYQITPRNFVLFDAESSKAELEKYFNDVYVLFMNKISSFAIKSENSVKEQVRLRALLEELIKIKKLLEGE